MEWKEYAKVLKELLGLKASPVAVTYSMKPPEGAQDGKHRACNALFDASMGKTINITAVTSACAGGSYYLGFVPAPKGEADKALKEFLIDGEKLCSSLPVFQRMRSLLPPPPTGLAENVVFSPMDKAEFKPDAVVFICNPLQGSRILTLDEYEVGIPPKINMLGSTCYQAIAYPVVTGEINVSLMDYTSRSIKEFSENDLLVTVPYHRMHGIMRSIDHCTAGRAKFVMPESFKKFASADNH